MHVYVYVYIYIYTYNIHVICIYTLPRTVAAPGPAATPAAEAGCGDSTGGGGGPGAARPLMLFLLLVCLNTQGDLGGTPGAPRGQLGCVENKSAEIVIGFFSRRCRLVDVQVSRISHHELHFLNTIAAVYLCLGYTVALLQNAPFVRCTAMSHLFVHEFEQIASDENMSGAPHTPARLLQ